jgi:hypothetical protein
MYINISERYGEASYTTIEEYQHAHPFGMFIQTDGEIRELYADGLYEVVAVNPSIIWSVESGNWRVSLHHVGQIEVSYHALFDLVEDLPELPENIKYLVEHARSVYNDQQ